MPSIANRRFPRVYVYKHARVQASHPMQKSISAVVYELGAQGCGLRTEEPLEIGSEVNVALYDSTRLYPLVFKAKIMWEGKIEGTTVFSYGLQFISVEGAATKAKTEIERILQTTGHKLAC